MSKTKAMMEHRYTRAKARGWAAGLTGAMNPYVPGSQCAILFDREKGRAIEARDRVLSEVKGGQG